MRRLCFLLIFISIFGGTFAQRTTFGQGGGYVPVDESLPYNAVDVNSMLGNKYFGDLFPPKQSYQPGVIITNAGDTLSGLFKYDNGHSVFKLSFKEDELSADSLISFEEIKSLITQYVYLKKVPHDGKDVMMRWLSVGKINLYGFSKVYGTSVRGITYALEKNNQFTYITKRDFKIRMKHVFFDDTDTLKKIGKKGYKFKNMVEIIMDYNKGFL